MAIMIIRVIKHTNNMCFGYGLFTKGIHLAIGLFAKGVDWIHKGTNFQQEVSTLHTSNVLK
jgi:hypothetical protein